MKLRYLHLSDFHLWGERAADPDVSWRTKGSPRVGASLLKTVEDLVTRGKVLDFIVITGDLIWRGKEEEFRAAEAFCRDLLRVTGLKPERLFVTPGNHDIDRGKVKPLDIKKWYNFETQDEITEALTDADVAPIFARKFSKFNGFAERVTGRRLFDDSNFYFMETIFLEKRGRKVGVNMFGLNTCMFAGYDGDDRQKLALGLEQVDFALSRLDKNALLSIGFFHHPFSCFHPVDDVSRNRLTENLDIILTGHAHHAADMVGRKADVRALVTGAGASRGIRDGQYTFNLAEIDLQTGDGLIQFYKFLPYYGRWKKDVDVNPDQEDGCVPFMLESVRTARLAPPPPRALYIEKASISNIQGFTDISADFTVEVGDIRMCSLFLGDNSAGKTSFLRCLALGVCDEIGVAKRIESFQSTWMQRGKKHATIEIDLRTTSGQLYRIVTRFEKNKFVKATRTYYEILPDLIPREISEDNFPWSDLFVCGYGAGRTLGEATEKYDAYSPRSAVGTLFDYNQPMQHPELSLRRLITSAQRKALKHKRSAVEKQTLHRFRKLIETLFMFTDQDRIDLTEKGIEVIHGKDRSLLLAHGDGYKNTAAWVLDLITWSMLAGRGLQSGDVAGVVLVDEIEQHLHPKWQRHIIRLLKERFTRIQFIFTTHSPLCAAGAADFDDDEFQLLYFQKDPGNGVEIISIPPLRGLRADQVLTSEAFGLSTTRNPAMADKLKKFGDLYLKSSRTREEEATFRELRDFMEENLPEPAEDAESRIIQKKLADMLKDLEILSGEKGGQS